MADNFNESDIQWDSEPSTSQFNETDILWDDTPAATPPTAQFQGADVTWDDTTQPSTEDAGIASDLWASFASGSNALLSGVGTLYGIATGDMDNWARRQGEAGQKYWETDKSATLKESEKARAEKIQAAEGEWAKAGVAVWETIKDPRLLATFVAGQLPMSIPGGAAGRVAGAAGTALGLGTKAAGSLATGAAVGTGAALQTADVSGSAYDSIQSLPNKIWEQNPEYIALRDEVGEEKAKNEIATKYARAVAPAVAAISTGSQFIPGGRTIEKALAGSTSDARKFLSRLVTGAIGEAGQEAIEEGSGAALGNLAVQQVSPEQSLTEGVGEAAGLGALGGGTLGAVASLAHGPGEPGAPPAPGAENVPPPAAPGAPQRPGDYREQLLQATGEGLYEPQAGDQVRVAGLGDAEVVGPSVNSQGVVNPNMMTVRLPNGDLRDAGVDLLAPREARPIDEFSDALKKQGAARQAEIDSIMPSDDLVQTPNVTEAFGEIGAASENVSRLAQQGLQETEARAQAEAQSLLQQQQAAPSVTPEQRQQITQALARDFGVDEATAQQLIEEADQAGTEGNLRYTAAEERDYNKPPVFRTKIDDLVAERVGDKPQNPRALREQIAAWQRKGEVKAEELQYIPVDTFLDKAAKEGRKVTKQEVLDFINQSAPKLGEVRLAGESKGDIYDTYVAQQVDKTARVEFDNDAWVYNFYDAEGNKFHTAQAAAVNRRFPDLEKKPYLLEDYWYDYSQGIGEDQIANEIEAETLPTKYQDYAALTPEEGSYQELLITDTRDYKADYEGPHWDEKNVLAHARFDERNTVDGEPVLFIHEIQSDLHQAGRKHGYKGPTMHYRLLMRANRSEPWTFLNEYKDQADADAQLGMFKKGAPDAEFKLETVADKGTAIPEEAPFKKTWPLLAFKRMLAEAVSLGKTRIAWATGKQNADVYNLRKYVSEIQATRNDDGTYEVLVVDKEGFIINDVKRQQTIEEVEANFGKEMATKFTEIPDGDAQMFSGKDLGVGGEGMIGFYDQILPAAVNKYLKKYGVHVQPVEVEQVGDKPAEVWSVEITPKMAADVGEGQPMFTAAPEEPTFKIKKNKDGSVEVRGDIEAIREMLPPKIIGRKLPGDAGLAFSHLQAPRVLAALQKSEAGYSREGQVLKQKPMKDGKYVGAPKGFDTPSTISKLRKALKALTIEGERGKMWYENSSKAVLQFVGGNVEEARKFVALLSIYSPQAKVDANGTFAIRAWAQYKAGLPIKVKTKVQDDKAQAALDNVDAFWSGEKTGNFFKNLLSEIDPATRGKQGATIDMWMMRAGQYDHDAPNASEYAFMEDETNRIAQELGWDPHQVQAAIWVAMKARMENPQVKKDTEASSFDKGWIDYQDREARKGRIVKEQDKHFANWIQHAMKHEVTEKDTTGAKFDFADALVRNLGQVSWEPVPSTKVPYMKGVHEAEYDVQLSYYYDLVDALFPEGRDELAEQLGLMVENGFAGPGVWEGAVTPSRQTPIVMAPAKAGHMYTDFATGDSLTVDQWEAAGKPGNYKKHKAIDPAQRKLLDIYSAVIGLVLRQDGVGYHRAFEGVTRPGSNTVHITAGRPLTGAEAAALEAGSPAGTAFVATSGGIRAINFSEIDNKQFQAQVEKAVEAIDSLDEVEIGYGFSDSNLVSNDWRNSPNGEDYIQTITQGGRPELVDWARSVLAPRVAKVNQQYAEQFNWGDPGPTALFAAAEEGPYDGRRVGVQVPSYGTAKPGAVTVQGVHFSPEPRETLDSARYGTGIRGAEKARLDRADADPNVRPRIFFYVDEGAGIQPERGVGTNAHTVNLENVYDLAEDPNGYGDQARQKFPTDADARLNEVERLVVEGGFDGIYVPGAMANMGTAVLLGEHKVTPMQGRPTEPTVAERPVSARDQMNQRLEASNLPAGRLRASAWLGKIAGTEFDTEANRAALAARGEDLLYRADLADVFTAEPVAAAVAEPPKPTLREAAERTVPRPVKRDDMIGKRESVAELESLLRQPKGNFKLATLSPQNRAILRQIENMLGRQIVMVDTGKYMFEGVVISNAKPNTIFLSSQHKHPILAVVGHEFIHTLRAKDRAAYARLGAAIIRANGLTDADVLEYKKQADYLRRNLPGFTGLSFDSALEEMIADMSGTIWNDRQFWQRLQQEDAGVFENLVKSFLDLIDRILFGLKSKVPNLPGGAYIKDLEKTREVLVEFYKDLPKTESEYSAAVHDTGNLKFATAYHGTGHDFDFFDENKVGTGEKNQAFGWGLYFAEEQEVAKFYRDFVAKKTGQAGVLYEVDLKFEEDTLLDWNYKTQPPQVQRAVSIINEKAPRFEVLDRDGQSHGTFADRGTAMRRKPPGGSVVPAKGFATGGHLYRHVERLFTEATRAGAKMLEEMGIDPYTDARAGWPADRLASAYLKSIGVDGVQFLDQKSRTRGAGSVTKNYVAFTDADVEIVAKNGETVVSELGPVDIEQALGLSLDLDEVTVEDGLATSDTGVMFSVAEEAAPKKTIKAYKMFRAKDGQLFPLFIDADKPTPVGQWIPAEIGDNEKSKIGKLALRPGWHAGDSPTAKHIGGKDKGAKKPTFRKPDQVWAEVEIPADVDWQTEAQNRAKRNKQGQIIPRTAEIKGEIPAGGHYRYKTNPNMEGEWIIGGALKINRILTDAEVEQLNKEAGTSDLPRQAPIDWEALGFDPNNLMFSVAGEEVKAATAPSFEAPTEMTWLDRFRMAVQNKYMGLLKVQDAIGADNILEEEDARLYQINYPGRVRAKIEEFEDTYYRQIQDFMRKSQFDLKEVGRYLHARHAQEANAVLKKRNPNLPNNDALSGMSDAEAQQILQQYQGNPDMVTIGRVVDSMHREKVNMLEQAGLLSATEAQAWRYDYAHYVPLYREDLGHTGMPGTGGSGFQAKGKVSKLRGGSVKPVDHANLLAHALAGVESAIVRIEKNEAAGALYRLAEAHPNEDIWQTDNLPTVPVMQADGTIRHQPNPNAPGVITLKENGENKYVVMNLSNPVAKALYDGWTNQGADTGPLAKMFMDPMLKLMRYWSAINTSLSPEFMISNFFRDFQTAGYNLGDTELKDAKLRTLSRVPSALKGIRNYLRGDQSNEWAAWYKRMEDAGGTTGWLQSYENIEDRAKQIEKGIGAARKLGWAWKGFQMVGDFISDYNSVIENGVRLAAFRTAVEAGLSERVAGKIAKELTVNFNEKGTAGSLLNSLYLFYNASVQGSMRTIRAMRSPMVRRFVYATVAFAALNHILNSLGDDDDEDYNKLDPKLRDRSLVFRSPWSDGLVTIPLPWGYNVFHIIGQEIGDAILAGMGEKKDYQISKSLERVGVGALEAFNPVNDGSLILTFSPTILDPAVKVLTNTEWHGGKLMPDWNEYQADYLKYFKSAREPSVQIAKWLAENTRSEDMTPMVDISPETLDMLWDTFTGSVGRFYADTVLTAEDIYSGKIKDRELKEIPLLRKVYREIGDSDVQRAFYSTYHDFKKSYQMYRENKDDKKFMRDAGLKMRKAWKRFDELEKEKRQQSKRLNKAIEKGNKRLEDTVRKKQLKMMQDWLDDHAGIMYDE